MPPVIRLIPLACAGILAAASVLSAACGGGSPGAPASPSTSAGPAVSGTATNASAVTTAIPTSSASETAACTPARPSTPGESTVAITSGGVDRTYILHVPPSYAGDQQTPLVLLFHGYSMGARLMLDVTGIGKTADANGFIVASLQGLGEPPAWGGVPPVPAASDVPFVRDVLAKLQAGLCIDPDRVFAAGYSNGGGMAQLLACEMGDQIAAVGVVAALYANCLPHAPVIAFHGTKDPLLPFDGGDIAASPGDDGLPPVRRSVSEWAVALGCDGLATISRDSPTVELSTFHNCTYGDGEALLYTIIGGGHTWPGAAIDLPADLVGLTTHDLDANALIWAFFAAHPLAH